MTKPPPHPRETFDWAGNEAHERAFLDAIDRGRLHHAWLVVGPEGVGKATFAYRAARRLLGAPPAPSLGPLGAAPDDPVSRQVFGRAHPDLLVIQRDPEDGKARRGIPVEEARALREFFAKSPASAPYRVAIIDTADDLNVFGANAVLKTLEEPPERGVLFVISHAPGGLLATIRSRCRRLRVDTPEPEQAAALAGRPGRGDDGRRRAASGHGPRRAGARLAAGGATAPWRPTAGPRTARPRCRRPTSAPPWLSPMAFADRTALAKFQLFFDRLADQIHAMAARRAAAGEGRRACWIAGRRLWDDLAAPREAEAINLDRADAFFTALGRLSALQRDAVLIDSHVNLHAPQFDEDREAVIARARAAGIGLMVTICDRVRRFAAVDGDRRGRTRTSGRHVGTHPHDAKENPNLGPELLCDRASPEGGGYRRDRSRLPL